jgi:hypothetical protein
MGETGACECDMEFLGSRTRRRSPYLVGRTSRKILPRHRSAEKKVVMNIRRITGVVLAAQILVLGLNAQSQKPSGQAPTGSASHAPLIGEQIRKTVGFLQVNFMDDNGHSKGIAGTCFFISYPDPRLPTGSDFIYLVTNRHMGDPGSEDGKHYPIQNLILRLNLTAAVNGVESEAGEIPLDGATRWYFPEDQAVDLAVLPWAPDRNKFDYIPFDFSMLATADRVESTGISADYRVVFAGYFWQWAGANKIQPIVREGVIAMIPDEKIETTLHKQGHLYLADAHAFHGNSGSPMLVNVGGIHGNLLTTDRYLLLGVVSGYWPEEESFSIPAARVLSAEVHDNSGIATVVPAYELERLLDSPILQTQRDTEVAKMKRARQP